VKNQRVKNVQFVEDDLPPGRPEKIRALLAPAMEANLKDADVITGVDEATGNVFLIYGRKLLGQIVESNTACPAKTVVVPILQATSELEALVAATVAAKGRHEYE
jgi:hypothetical protein